MQEFKYKLSLRRLPDTEMVHHADDTLMVTSHFNTVTTTQNGSKYSFRLPLPFHYYVIGLIRLVRRALRLDKCSIVVSHDRTGLVITYNGNIYRYCLKTRELSKTYSLEQCRTVLHMSIATIAPDKVIMGEYGRNPDRNPVPIHMSEDGGRTWSTPFLFPAKTIRHIHGVYHDHETGHIWVPTGDFRGECYLYEFADSSFGTPTIHGDGSQLWRTVNLFFTPDSVVWVMDSELGASHAVEMDRKSGAVTKGQTFPGPVWYIKTLSDGFYLVQTTVETGAGVVDDSVHIYISRNLRDWTEIAAFSHDGLPLRYFKNAVIAFPNGSQSSEKFYLSAEALKAMDGKSFECTLTEIGGSDE